MMTPDRRARMVELAEAMAEVRAFARDYSEAAYDISCPPHLRRLGEDSLDAAAERLDAAWKALQRDDYESTPMMTIEQ